MSILDKKTLKSLNHQVILSSSLKKELSNSDNKFDEYENSTLNQLLYRLILRTDKGLSTKDDDGKDIIGNSHVIITVSNFIKNYSKKVTHHEMQNMINHITKKYSPGNSYKDSEDSEGYKFLIKCCHIKGLKK